MSLKPKAWVSSGGSRLSKSFILPKSLSDSKLAHQHIGNDLGNPVCLAELKHMTCAFNPDDLGAG
jgi:hypothetical protein